MEAHLKGEQYDVPPRKWLHSVHCLSDLRQVVLCNLDETLFTFTEDIHPGFHQPKVCKDLRPIDAWLEWNYEGKYKADGTLP